MAASHITLRHTWKMAIITSVILVITAGALLGVARLLSPMASQFRGDIEVWASAAAGQPVKIGALNADWSGLLPQIRLTDVRVYDPQGEGVLLRFSDMRMRVDPVVYLRDGRVEPSHLSLEGVSLSLIRTPQGHVVLEGFEDRTLSDGAFLPWLLRQGRLDIRQSQIAWTDREAGRARQSFSDVNLLLRTDGKRHQLNGTLALPGAMPARVMLALDFGGDLNAPATWGGKVYLQADALDLAAVQRELHWPGRVALQGAADFKLWGLWSGTRLQRLEGEAAARGVRLAASGQPPLLIRQTSAQLQWQREDSGWRLSAERFVLQRATASVPSRFVVVSHIEKDVRVLDARFSEWRMEDVSALLLVGAALAPALTEPLRGLEPRGVLRDVRVRFTPGPATASVADTFKNFYLRARVEGLHTHAYRSLPALDNVSGVLQCDERSGAFELNTRSAQLAGLLRKPLAIAQATGRVGWQRGEHAWRVGLEALDLRNDDISAQVAGTIDWPLDGGSPLVDLQSRFEIPRIGRVPDYLPESLSEKARAWITRALVTGRVTSGTALVRGQLSDFPFDAGSGLFEARLNVSDTVLDYEAGWPWLGEIEGEVVFRRRGMEINAVAGKIFDSSAQKISAVIPDLLLDEPQLTMRGEVRGATTDVLRLLRESPLKDTWANSVAGLSAGGQVTLNLDLLIPLSEQPNQIKGTLQFRDSALHYVDKAQERDIELTRINGALNFTGDMHLTGNDIDAVLLDHKVKLALKNETPEAPAGQTRQALVIEARGNTDPADLARQLKRIAPDLPAGALDTLRGSTDWLAVLRLRAGAGSAIEADWRLESSLQGMALQWPEPVGKTAPEAVRLALESVPGSGQNRRFLLRYGSRLNGVFELARAKNSWTLARGELRFGVTVATLPPQGLRISGELEHLPVTEWQTFLAHGISGGGGLAARLNAVDVRIGALDVFGQRFSNTQIRATQTPQAWEANVSGAELAGSLRLPREKESALVLNLERMYLNKIDGGASISSKGTDPRHWPPLRIDVANFKYADADLGRLHLDAAKRSSGLRIDSLSLASPSLHVTGQGDWVVEQDKPASRFTAKASGDDMGKMLAAFGFAASVSGGKSQFDLTAAWEGSPADFALERLNGNLSLKVTKGRLLEIDPGAGRVFGLLSLQALPRRLTLDFSDIFAKGFSFDRLEGYFVFENGNAYTNNLTMEGPSANITVTGRTGLAAKDYDQVVTVKPEISDGLSLGAGLVGGPVVGLGLFLADKLLPGLKDIATYQYTIKGPWKEPVIAPLEQQEKAAQKKSAG